jgi:hypothetical protein
LFRKKAHLFYFSRGKTVSYLSREAKTGVIICILIIVIMCCLAGNNAARTVVALVLLSSAIVYIQGEKTTHPNCTTPKPHAPPYSLTTEHPEESNFFLLKTAMSYTEDGLVTSRRRRGGPFRYLENQESESVSDRESAGEDENDELESVGASNETNKFETTEAKEIIEEEFTVEPVETTAQQMARGPVQIGDHFNITISSNDNTTEIQPAISSDGNNETFWVYHLCHPGASFINVHFADLGKLFPYSSMTMTTMTTMESLINCFIMYLL